MTRLGSLIAPAATPVDEDGRIDGDLFAGHVRRLLADGMDQVLLFGTTGEGAAFSAAEKAAALEALIAAGLPPAKLLVGTGTSVLSDAVAIVAHAASAGCAAALVLPPFFPKAAHEEGVTRWFQALAARTAPFPLLLYNIPQTAGVGFTADGAAALFDGCPSIAGLKDSSPGSPVADALAARGYPGIYAAQDSGLLDRKAGGVAGLISATLDIAPRLARAAFDGDRAAFETFLAVSRAMAPYPLVWSVKTLLAHHRGEAGWRHVTPPHALRGPADAGALIAAVAPLMSHDR